MNLETLITLGYYVSSIGFLVATVLTAITVSKFGKSSLASIFSYLLIGTGIFFVITIFQKLGAEFFMIPDESMDVWWHIMFYMAMISYYFGFKALIGLGTTENGGVIGAEKKWAIVNIILLVIIFIIPSSAEPVVSYYLNTTLANLGLHHFIAFALAAGVGYYLVNAKKNLGMIGKAIANPMIIAIWALAIQHFWELLAESWHVVVTTSDNVEGVEKIFLTIASICVIVAALKLKSFAVKPQ